MAPELVSYCTAMETILLSSHWLGSESVPLAETLGRYLAEDVRARVAMPRFDSSSVDGFAVGEADLDVLQRDGRLEARVIGTTAAGDKSGFELAAALVVRVMTGARVPTGTVAMVMQEQSIRSELGVVLTDQPDRGAFLRREGAEFGEGELLLPRGTRLDPANLGLAASGGNPTVEVARRARVGILITGSELVAPGNELEDGQVYESVSVGLVTALRGIGVSEVLTMKCRDDLLSTELNLGSLLDSCDVVITCGGASYGAFDFVRRASKNLGVRNEVAGVAIKPGKPFHFGMRDDVALFGLPGNPLSALVTFSLFVAPYLRACAGALPVPSTFATLTEDVHKEAGRAEFAPCCIVEGRAELVAMRSSHMLIGLSQATHLIELPLGEDNLQAGSAWPIHPLPWSRS